jgi:predicted dehydrogenase
MDLYGYIAEWRDAISAFQQGKNALLNFEYGRLITMLIMAAYLSHENRRVIDLTDPEVLKELQDYIPLIQQGKGAKVL